ncbi:MAG: UDP-N-acetylmuramate dehydrogenase [Candidatus Andersenbacteria bacterium]
MSKVKLRIQENVPLAPLTTLKVGGPARYFVEVTDEIELSEALTWARDKKIEVFAFGGGSNVVVNDAGFNGLVIKLNLKGIQGEERGNRAILTVAAGESWDDVVAHAVEHGWGGIENLSGIPGSAGGAIVQNVGAYGQTVADTVHEVHAVEVATGQSTVFNRAACKFAYRDSYFKHEAHGRYILTKIVLQLTKNPAINLSFKGYRGSLADKLKGTPATLTSVRQAVLDTRGSMGYLLKDGYERFQSVGSFFTNPVVPRSLFTQVEQTAKKLNPKKTAEPKPWHWDQPDGKVKLAAAFLIEFTDFKKGFKRGNVGISPKHNLSLITYPGATAAELVRLAREIQEAVLRIFTVKLSAEAQLVGFEPYPLLK